MVPLLIHEKGCLVEEKKNRREMFDPIIWGKMEGRRRRRGWRPVNLPIKQGHDRCWWLTSDKTNHRKKSFFLGHPVA